MVCSCEMQEVILVDKHYYQLKHTVALTHLGVAMRKYEVGHKLHDKWYTSSTVTQFRMS